MLHGALAQNLRQAPSPFISNVIAAEAQNGE
jgi:hypothetical protein